VGTSLSCEQPLARIPNQSLFRFGFPPGKSYHY
jgi:hypothetical protein